MTRDYLFYLFFPRTTAFMIGAGLHIVYLIPLMAFFYSCFTRYRRTILSILFAYCLQAATLYLIAFFQWNNWPSMIDYINIGVTAPFIPIIFMIVSEFLHKNELIRFLFPGILVVIFFGIGTIIGYDIAYQLTTNLYLLSILMLITIIWIYYLLRFLKVRVNEQSLLQSLQLKNEITLKGYQNLAMQIDEIRAIRHEVGHHLAALRILCATGTIENVIEYLEAVSSDLEKSAIVYSNHYLIDSIIATGIINSKKYDIKVSHLIDVPSQLSIADIDLCSLLTNLMENAIEACMKQESGQARWIHIQIRKKGQHLIISCENSTPLHLTKADVDHLTTKSDPVNHGYGLKIIRSIVKKYGSILDISQDTDRFCVRTMFPLD